MDHWCVEKERNLVLFERSEQFSIIEKLRKSYSINTLCEVFNIHRSNYKYWRNREKAVSPDLVKIRSLIKEVHTPVIAQQVLEVLLR